MRKWRNRRSEASSEEIEKEKRTREGVMRGVLSLKNITSE